MKQFTIFTAALICFTPFASLPANSSLSLRHEFSSHRLHHSSQERKAIGDFKLRAKGEENTLFLDNNKAYEPLGSVNEQIAGTWSLFDTIRVLKVKKSRRYLLANRRTGETIEARIRPRLKKKAIGDFSLIAKGQDQKVLLGNNIFYRPSGEINEEKLSDWNVGDVVRVLKAKKHHYLLVNLTLGELVLVKIFDINSTSSSSSH